MFENIRNALDRGECQEKTTAPTWWSRSNGNLFRVTGPLRGGSTERNIFVFWSKFQRRFSSWWYNRQVDIDADNGVAWQQTGDYTLPGPMMIPVNDTYASPGFLKLVFWFQCCHTVAQKPRRDNVNNYIAWEMIFQNEQKILMSGPREYVGAPIYYVGASTCYVAAPTWNHVGARDDYVEALTYYVAAPPSYVGAPTFYVRAPTSYVGPLLLMSGPRDGLVRSCIT